MTVGSSIFLGSLMNCGGNSLCRDKGSVELEKNNKESRFYSGWFDSGRGY